jgi:hypothetical protein
MGGPGSSNPACDPAHFGRGDSEADDDVDLRDVATFSLAFGE